MAQSASDIKLCSVPGTGNHCPKKSSLDQGAGAMRTGVTYGINRTFVIEYGDFLSVYTHQPALAGRDLICTGYPNKIAHCRSRANPF
jgi:hypothetical protein